MPIWSLVLIILVILGIGYYFDAKKIKEPLTRVVVIKRVKQIFLKSEPRGICSLFFRVLKQEGIDVNNLQDVFPLLNYSNATVITGTTHDLYKPYFWNKEDKQSRIRFLNWLEHQYREDSEDLRKTFGSGR